MLCSGLWEASYTKTVHTGISKHYATKSLDETLQGYNIIKTLERHIIFIANRSLVD